MNFFVAVNQSDKIAHDIQMRVGIGSGKTKHDLHRVIFCISKFDWMAQCHDRKPSTPYTILGTSMRECHAFSNYDVRTKFIDQMKHCLHIRVVETAFFHQWVCRFVNGLLPILGFFSHKNPLICKNIT